MILLIDNQGLSTFTLQSLIISLGADVTILNSDKADVGEALRLEPEAIIISPGSGEPARAGFSIEIVKRCAGVIPILGIALGMQAIALAFEGQITKSEAAVHGKQSEVIHDGRTIFEGIPSPMLAGRYDSILVSEKDLPSELRISAHTRKGEIMAVRSDSGIVEGVQFHPESILSPRGKDLLMNFLELVRSA